MLDIGARRRARRVFQLVVEDFLRDRRETLKILGLIRRQTSLLDLLFLRWETRGDAPLSFRRPSADRLLQVLQQLAGAALGAEPNLAGLALGFAFRALGFLAGFLFSQFQNPAQRACLSLSVGAKPKRGLSGESRIKFHMPSGEYRRDFFWHSQTFGGEREKTWTFHYVFF